MDKKQALRKKLNDKIKQKELVRSTKEVKEHELQKDESLNKLGINNKDDLLKFMDSIKDIDKGDIIEKLMSMGIQREQIEQFFKMFGK